MSDEDANGCCCGCFSIPIFGLLGAITIVSLWKVLVIVYNM